MRENWSREDQLEGCNVDTPAAMMPEPRVACVIVHWNNWPDTSACLDSLLHQDYPNLSVTVVDNGSSDGSLARLRSAFPSVHFVAHPENAGFARGCNLGARQPDAAEADLIWLLNNDTIVPPETARKLVEAARADPRAGIIGAVLYSMHDRARVQAWGGGRISRWTAYNQHFHAPAEFGPGTYITFASALIRRGVWDQLGGLYEGAFMYFEDADFSLRARAAGWRLAVASDTAILHREGGSTVRQSDRKDRLVTVAALHFLSRHAPVPAIGWILFLALRLGRRIARADWSSCRAVLAGVREWSNKTKSVP